MARALILADGEVPTRARLDAAWPRWDADIGFVVAADGGARHADALGVTIDRWVGDGDSLDPTALATLEAAGVPVERARSDKDETDTELAIRAALGMGADGIVVLGALGGSRIDHALANIGLLALPELSGRPAVILDASARITLLEAPDRDGNAVGTTLVGRVGDLVSLLPHGAAVTGVTTAGLVYPLDDEALPAGTPRGLSNVIEAQGATVRLRSGRLLIVETPATFAV